MKTSTALRSSSALLALAAHTAFAQVNPPARDNRPGLLDAMGRETAASSDEALREDGGNPDELTRLERALRMRVNVNNDFAYQSNAELDGRGGEGDFVWFPGVAGSATYKLSDKVSLEGRAALEAGLYADLTDLNVWGASAELLGRYDLGASWSAYAGAEVYDYQSLDDGDDLSRSFTPEAGLSYGRYYAASRTYAFAKLGVKHHYADPAANERDEVAVSVGASKQVAEKLHVQGFYEYRFADYEDGGREDQRHYVSASLIYLFNESVRASLGVSFVDNDSNIAGADYQSVNTGLGSSLSWEF